MITRELDFRRRRAEIYRSRARAEDRAGEPEGAELACAACGCRMVKLAAARGQLLLASHEVAAGVGPAEECVECGRAWCARCYPRKPRGCPCGIGQEARRWDDGVVRHGSVRLVKVHYP
ncbi:MAG TPA: hypothetical protein VFJ82_25570 [Longimicrobium sp.]|nr:hypothetical protein [Longimicrobium sp.]